MEGPVRRPSSQSWSRQSSLSQVNVRETTELVCADGRSITVTEKINEIGFGPYQLQVFILCAGVVMSEAGCLQTAAGLSTTIAEEFNVVYDFAKAAQMLSAYVGFAIGTLSSGTLGDALGRRVPILLGYVGMVTSSGCLYVAPSYALLCFFYFILGCFAGVGIPASFTVLAEVTPAKARGAATGALALAFCGGELWASVGFRLLLPQLMGEHWRNMIWWAALPPIFMLVFGALSRVTRFDTPLFLGVRGRGEELAGVMNLMAELNGVQGSMMTLGPDLPVDKEDATGLLDALTKLTSGRQLLYVAVLSVMFFAKDLAFYGMGVFWPLAWTEAKYSSDIYPATELVLTAALGFPGVGVAMILMFLLPRRIAFATTALLTALGAWAVKGVLDAELELGLTGVVLFKLFYPTTQMTTILFPSEIFSTQVRVWSLSIIAFCGRLATLAAPIIISWSQHAFLYIAAALLWASALLVWLLPETKDQELLNSTSDVESKALASKDCEGQYGQYGSTSSSKGTKAAGVS
eukprot:gb/GFBE01007891.1/.p1 GENE.gb/GFBE01007891.1/~~gb/GFBE01007891.1/.p1  ORF type:complete len:521 (+),score=100.40 gb/GFBE01007891.1/:1-1563(+)